LKTIAHSAGEYSGIPCGLNVHTAIAYHDGLLADGAGIAHDRMNADRVRLLKIEAVAAVNVFEVTVDTKSGQDFVADANRLIGQYVQVRSGCFQRLKRR
jgi:hypothetical protein